MEIFDTSDERERQQLVAALKPPPGKHWLPPLVTTIGYHHWLPPLVTTIGYHRWLRLLVTTIGYLRWLPLLVTTTGYHCWLPPLWTEGRRKGVVFLGRLHYATTTTTRK